VCAIGFSLFRTSIHALAAEQIAPGVTGITCVFDYPSYLSEQGATYEFKDRKTHTLQFSVKKKSYFVFEVLRKKSSSAYNFVLSYSEDKASGSVQVLKHSHRPSASPEEVNSSAYSHCMTFQYRDDTAILLYTVPLVPGVYKFKIRTVPGTKLYSTLLQNNKLFSIANAYLSENGKAVSFRLNCAPSLVGCSVFLMDCAYDPEKEWQFQFLKGKGIYKKSLCFAQSKYKPRRIEGDVSPEFRCTKNGSYTVVITDPLGQLFLFDTLSITQLQEN